MLHIYIYNILKPGRAKNTKTYAVREMDWRLTERLASHVKDFIDIKQIPMLAPLHKISIF